MLPIKSTRLSRRKNDRRARQAGDRRISVRTIVFVVLISLLLGAFVIVRNVQFEEREKMQQREN